MRPPDLRRAARGGVAPCITALTKKALISWVNFISSKTGFDCEVFFLGDPFGVQSNVANSRTRFVPDPVGVRKLPSRAEARTRLGISESARVVAILGAIGQRKNPGLVAQAIARLPGDVLLLLAGETEREADEAILDAGLSSERIVRLSGYISDEDLSTAARAADIIAAVYENHHSSSGILALAAQSNVPVVVPEGGLLEHIVVSLGTGLATQLSVTSIASTLEETLSDADALKQSSAFAAELLNVGRFVSAMVTNEAQESSLRTQP
jgi:glycosyltransferase involved in cell wall biosynthesis